MGKTAFVLAWGVLVLILSPRTEAVWRPSTDLQARSRAASLARFPAGEVIAGFRVIAAYTNQAEDVVGLRLTHVPTGMPIHLFQMQTVPQAAILIRTALQSELLCCVRDRSSSAGWLPGWWWRHGSRV